MKLEACIETLTEAKAAAKYGLDRVELCSALDLGGLTPSAALIESASGFIQTHVMIRPRAGDFVYTVEEIKLMQADIQRAEKYGATGVVFGCLNDFNQVDEHNNKRLVETAKNAGLQCTFHRAFDFVFVVDEALELIVDLGFQRILTSGGQATAINGLNQIMQLITQAKGRIEIMAGSGVNASNILALQQTGIDAAHFSIRKKQNRMASLNMGAQYEVDESKITEILKTLGR